MEVDQTFGIAGILLDKAQTVGSQILIPWKRYKNQMIPFKKLLIDSQRAIYFEIPKVACTTINYLLIKLIIRPGEEFEVNDVHSDMSLPRIWGGLQPAHGEYFKFAFVRNPYSRLRSCYRDKIKPRGFNQPGLYDDGLYVPFQKFKDAFWPGMDFESFVNSVCEISDTEADPHFRSQVSFICNEQQKLLMDFVGRFETLEADIEKLMERFTIPKNQYVLPHINKQNYDKTTQYSETAIERIQQRYSADFECFGYDMVAGLSD